MLQTTQKGGFGGVIRNFSGLWIIGFMGSVQNTSPLATEMLALFHGLCIAQLHNIQPLQIEMDALAVIQLLCNPHANESNLLFDCRWLFTY